MKAMFNETNKALYDLLQTYDIAFLATDIYWGNNNHFDEKEKAAFSDEDYNKAYHLASLEMMERIIYGNDFPYENPDIAENISEDMSPAWDRMICAMADLYGKHLRLIQTEKSLKEEKDNGIRTSKSEME